MLGTDLDTELEQLGNDETKHVVYRRNHCHVEPNRYHPESHAVVLPMKRVGHAGTTTNQRRSYQHGENDYRTACNRLRA